MVDPSHCSRPRLVLCSSGCIDEFLYRFGANLTITVPCGEHATLQRFARYILIMHSLAFNFFVSCSLVIVLQTFTAPEGSLADTVSDAMQKYQYVYAGAVICFRCI